MKKWIKSLVISLILTACIAGIYYYICLPAINIKALEFWFYIVGMLLFFAVVFGCSLSIMRAKKKKAFMFAKVTGGIGAGLFVLMMLLLLASSTFFHARRYSEILNITENCDFDADLSETLSTDTIAIMDTDSAQMLGDRKLGSLSDLVSQYNVSESYTQINYQDAPAKVAALDYAGFFKYMKNKSTGIPGYVLVSPVDMSASYIDLEENMQYVPSACFSKDLLRHIRSKYPSAMIREIWFEIDESGKPYYIASVYDHTIGLFGGEDIVGAIIVDPVNGEMEYDTVGNIPSWVDVIYDGDLLCEQYDYYGELRNGFWNSQFSAEGCKVTTDDYGFIAMDGDIWIYTGVTSVNSDASNIGFVLMNERTKEARFYEIAGADEYSAMIAAEGEVQQYGYIASFPSLINVDGNATYIMVLKDDGGLVKMFAAVNAEQYNIVATASTQKECIEKYQKMISSGEKTDTSNGSGQTETEPKDQTQVQPDESLFVETEVTIRKMEQIVVDGNTYLYLLTEDGSIYHAKYTNVLAMMAAEEGQRITIRVYEDWFLCE